MLLTVLFFVLAALAAPTEDAWEATIDEAVPAVVVIRVTQTRDFDTENARSSQGTGFIVDLERGILLTNRHMVHAGPVIAEGFTQNDEEFDLQAIYRDPVHDFGFYRFDPEAVADLDVAEMPLAPDGLKVGVGIRVIGNDAGEKLSILDGTISRLHRAAPRYGGNTYNDFNTFYVQAGSNTSGGSSGSPVIDIQGRAIALNAGGATRAASSFYLPLDRVVRALEYIEKGETPPRGTIQTVFVPQSYDELERLGLPEPTEARVRTAFPDMDGMLVVSEVVPVGPAWELLEPGDILVEVSGELIVDFASLEAALDESVGETVALTVQRGSQALKIEVPVNDLHAITPDEFLEVGRAILHDLSYQQARNHNLPVAGVYVAVPGYMLARADLPGESVITHVDGEPVYTLDDLQALLEKKADGERVRFRFFLVQEPRRSFEVVASMDRHWFPMRRCVRDDSTGNWPCTESPPPPKATPMPVAETIPLAADDRVSAAIAPSLAIVDFDIPYPTAGVRDLNYVGVGTVVDAERGLLIVDRDTVPVGLGDIEITFGGAVRVPGEVVYLHPVHNFAILGFDPELLGDTPIEAVEWAKKQPEEGDKIWQVGLNRRQELVSTGTTIDRVGALSQGLSRTPRFRDANVAGYNLADGEWSLGGVLADKKGRVHALWASFLDQRENERSYHGLPAEFILPVLEPLRRGETPDYRILGVEFRTIPMHKALERGLSDERLKTIIEHDPENREVLEVARRNVDTPAAELLQDADLLVAVDGKPMTSMFEIEELHDRDEVVLTLLRDAQEVEVTLPMTPVDGRGIDRVVSFAGVLAHEPHYEVAAQRGVEPVGPYIAWMWYGSPAARYGLRPTRRVLAVDDTPVTDIDSFLEAVRGLPDRHAIRLKLEGLDGSTVVETLKLDLQYWPTTVLERKDGEWVQRQVKGDSP